MAAPAYPLPAPMLATVLAIIIVPGISEKGCGAGDTGARSSFGDRVIAEFDSLKG